MATIHSLGESEVRVARLDVDEGFLDGLGVDFTPGLNVLIGARGVGKTSVVELLRFALGAPWFTSDAKARSEQQVRSVLGGGLVRVTLVDGGGAEAIVVRSLRDDAPRANGSLPLVTVLAQNEIEAVGAQPQGRLGLVDRFLPITELRSRGSQIMAELRSVGVEVLELERTIARLSERIELFADVDEALAEATDRQQAALQNVEATREDQQQLESLRSRSSALVAQREAASIAHESIASVAAQRSRLTSIGAVPDWPIAAGPADLLSEARLRAREASEHFVAAWISVDEALDAVERVQRALEQEQARVDTDARALRAILDSLQVGLGEVTRHVDQLRERSAQRDAWRQQLAESESRLVSLTGARRRVYEEIERLRSTRCAQRTQVAARLTDELAPHVRLDVRGSGARGGFAAALVEALKGSGLHYNRLAAQLANVMSPLELVELVEARDVVSLTSLANIPSDRAQAVVAHLSTVDLTDLLISPLDDAVDLWLLDNTDFKPASELSIGQRCTAVLPVLLRSESDILIVDQPEDHLDNAFVTGPLVSALAGRSANVQLIFASHNANIPVLGNADHIVHLDSDGRRGFVRRQGALDDAGIVRSISDIMEGGAEAFRRRAAFYARYSE